MNRIAPLVILALVSLRWRKRQEWQVADTAETEDPVERLRQLKGMMEKSLITEADYEAKKGEILKEM